MDAPVRYPELFLVAEESTPRAYWTLLRYFNFYRIALAAAFFAVTLVYDDALSLGSHSLELFRYSALAYLASEYPEKLERVKRVMPPGRDGQPTTWPACTTPARATAQSAR